MNFVQPIRDQEIIDGIKIHLKETNPRNYILFVVGIYTGLRISDILQLKVGDVKKDRISLRETKTQKLKSMAIHPKLKAILKSYLVDKQDHEYLIKSRKGKNKPIKREMAYKILRAVADEFDLESIGCHTMRKTFGYHFHKQTNNSEMLREIFNHSDVSITRKYIGVEQDTIDEAIFKLKI
ncbi:site-specific integrase [Brevibacillus sp. DP1.3A]|uniref:site-specific integrase n=1 Tax=Brevibacillus sp. DP1.3A TaxID=2738867 RepID=UPI00156ACCF6|nr:site-specific integrase [Brevibacillus sp. DP1.3A]UED78038.1 site-specific integrase [Brevibacillus sp. DP1.3A]